MVALLTYFNFDMEFITGFDILRCNWNCYNVIDTKSGSTQMKHLLTLDKPMASLYNLPVCCFALNSNLAQSSMTELVWGISNLECPCQNLPHKNRRWTIRALV